MKTLTSNDKNYLHELLKKKYHTSEVVRVQIAEIKDKTRDDVVKESLKSFTVKFRGRAIDSSFEKTLRIISKRLFNKGKIDNLHTFKERGFVEANITATLTEVESLIQYLMKPHLVLHCKKGIVKGASYLLIIDESEQSQLDNFTPDYVHRNYITHAETYEKYTGRLYDYLILKLDLEQHYLKLRTFNSQEDNQFNKFEILYRDMSNLGIIGTQQEPESIHGILADLQKLLFDKPLKENAYQEIVHKISSLEDFVTSKNKSSHGKGSDANATMQKPNQNPVFKSISDVKTGIQNIVEKEAQGKKSDTFKNEPEFFSFSAKELDGFLECIELLHEKLKETCYYKNIAEFEAIEKKLDRLIDEVRDIESYISAHIRFSIIR